MITPEEKQQYHRHFLIDGFTTKHQELIFGAKVLVIGAGGLGTPVLFYLAGAGVGHLGIAEFDTVELSNLPRQIAYSKNDLGQPKTKIIREKIKLLNPSCEVVIFNNSWSNINASQITKEYDMIIDCSDNYETRYLSNTISKEFKIPMVYGAVHQLEGQMAVFNYNGSRGYDDLFPEKKSHNHKKYIGILGPVAGIIGSMQAIEALKIITGYGNVLVNKLLVISLKHNRSRYVDF